MLRLFTYLTQSGRPIAVQVIAAYLAFMAGVSAVAIVWLSFIERPAQITFVDLILPACISAWLVAVAALFWSGRKLGWLFAFVTLATFVIAVLSVWTRLHRAGMFMVLPIGAFALMFTPSVRRWFFGDKKPLTVLRS